MPWRVARGRGCPDAKPWAVIKTTTGERVGCHASEAAAKKQVAALYANEPGTGRGYHRLEDAMAAVERRYTNVVVELRANDGTDRIGGYAAVFKKHSRNLGGFVEQVMPSALNNWRSQNWPDVIARFDHDNSFLLGTTAAHTLELRVDNTGLLYEVTPPKARADILELVQRGDIRHSSFAFRVPNGGDDWKLSDDEGFPLRSLLDIQLVDVAPVVQPAYPDATAGLRSLAARFDAPLEEVRSMAEANELRRFFVKTEAGKPPKRRLSGASALARIREREGV